MSKPTRPQPFLASGQKSAKQSATPQPRTKSAAPSVYRPQPTPKVLQRKAATVQPLHVGPTKRTHAAPPVYKPQPTPKVLQTKKAAGEQPSATRPARTPVAPTVYRAATKKIVQPKASSLVRPRATPPPARNGSVQRKGVGGVGPLKNSSAPPPPSRPGREAVIQRTLRITEGPGAGLYNSGNLRTVLDAVAVVLNKSPYKGRPVVKGPLGYIHSEVLTTFRNLEALADYMVGGYEAYVAPIMVAEREPPALLYGKEHGDYHFTGKVTMKKAQWTIAKGEALTLMEAEIQKHIDRLMSESKAEGWEMWYVGGDAGEKIGETVAGNETKFTIQVQVNKKENVISYHGYPDQRLVKTGAGKGKSSID